MAAFSRLLSRNTSLKILNTCNQLVKTPETGFLVSKWVPRPAIASTTQICVHWNSTIAPVIPAMTVGRIATTKIDEDSIDIGKPIKSNDTQSKISNEEFPFKLKRITFRTCKELYQSQSLDGGQKLPMDGIEVDVGYIDTGYPESPNGEPRRSFPTVLCLHGAAGTHKDLAGVITSLAARGARVLCPNFPGYGATPMDPKMHFTHTTIENCYFVLDFLKALGVHRLDMIAAFSCGCYTAVPLASKSGLQVNGLALLQLPGHRPYKAVKPFWVLKTVVAVMKRPIVRKILSPISYAIMKVTGWKHIPSIDTPYIMGLVTTGVPFDSYKRISSELPFYRIPLLLTFSEDDRFMDAEISYEYADLVGLPKDSLTVIHAEGHVEKKGAPTVSEDTYLKGLVFRKGGHYAQRKEPSGTVMKNTVVELYDHICRNRAALASVSAHRVANATGSDLSAMRR